MFRKLNVGRMYLWAIHRNHSHNGMCPHAHVLDVSNFTIGQAEIEKEMNKYCGMVKDKGKVIPY